jgi:hypothetical protein
MYWLRTENINGVFLWLLLCGFWWSGGWLLATHLFHLKSRERLMAGLATGMLLFIVFSNIIALSLSVANANRSSAALLTASYIGGSVLTLGIGWLSAYLNRRHRRADIASSSGVDKEALFDRHDLKAWPQLLVLVGLLAIFAMINRGLAIFDDYYNLPITSFMASGDVPPHLYLNPESDLGHHYGLNLFAASLMRIGELFAWSAFDLSKALTLSLTIILAWLWFRRYTGHESGAYWGSLLVLFGSGARWILLFVPQVILQRMGDGLRLMGSALQSGTDLYTVLLSPWKIEGGGPVPFLFAFTNGISSPLNMAMGSNGALPQMTIFLLLLLAKRRSAPRWQPLEGIVFGLLLASLALSAEYFFIMIIAGMLVTALWVVVSASRRRNIRPALIGIVQWGWILLPAILLAVFGGGVITEILRSLITQSGNLPADSSTLEGFFLRWPPALTSAHFGPLALTKPGQILIALAEIGLLILLAPLAIIWSIRRARRGQWAPAWLAFGALFSFIISFFIYYGAERDTARLAGSALFIWVAVGFPMAWFIWCKSNRWIKTSITLAYAITILAGIALFSIQLISIARPQFSYFVTTPDVQLSRAHWDKLEPQAQIFDIIPYRAVTLFGRGAGHAYQDLYKAFDDWSALAQAPDPLNLARAGYSYVYVDKETWQAWTPGQKQAFQQACVKKLDEQVTQERDFRWLLDIRTCR